MGRLRWSYIRAIGNAPLVRASVVVPVAGYLILLNDQVMQLAEIDSRLRLILPACRGDSSCSTSG